MQHRKSKNYIRNASEVTDSLCLHQYCKALASSHTHCADTTRKTFYTCTVLDFAFEMLQRTFCHFKLIKMVTTCIILLYNLCQNWFLQYLYRLCINDLEWALIIIFSFWFCIDLFSSTYDYLDLFIFLGEHLYFV